MTTLLEQYITLQTLIEERAYKLASAYISDKNTLLQESERFKIKSFHVKTTHRTAIGETKVIRKIPCEACGCTCTKTEETNYNINVSLVNVLDDDRFTGVLDSVKAGNCRLINVCKLTSK